MNGENVERDLPSSGASRSAGRFAEGGGRYAFGELYLLSSILAMIVTVRMKNTVESL
jgi:hypothetical protein